MPCRQHYRTKTFLKTFTFHLPICSFRRGHIESIPYIPLLAKEGVKHKVGGDGARGGLLLGILDDEYDRNVLQALINRGTKGPTHNQVLFDNAMLNAMKELREAKLLRKEDIDEYSLLYWTCRRKCQLRFEFLLDWISEGLKVHGHEGKPIIHAIIENEELSIKHFTMFSLELQCLEIMYSKTKSIYYKMPF